MSLTIRQVVNRLRKYNPVDVHEAMRCIKLPFQFIGEGSFRTVYSIGDLPIVIKFPTGEDGETIEENIEHSANEMDAINQVFERKECSHIRPYVPIMYYYNKNTGVILSRKYKQTGLRTNHRFCKAAAEEIKDAFQKNLDIYKNFSVNDDGDVVLIDWGVLGDLTDWTQSEF
jgi:pyruvate/2-oxoacid:ferredoxin oxidoreductase alpha subunit